MYFHSEPLRIIEPKSVDSTSALRWRLATSVEPRVARDELALVFKQRTASTRLFYDNVSHGWSVGYCLHLFAQWVHCDSRGSYLS